MHFRVVGTRHSFNDVADTDGCHISFEYFDQLILDEEVPLVIIGAGITYTALIEFLVENKLAIENLPSLPHVNVVGSLVTGSHGGGVDLKPLANMATGLRMMNPMGEMVVSQKGEDPDFNTHMHAWGVTGAITNVALNIEPEFAVRKCIY